VEVQIVVGSGLLKKRPIHEQNLLMEATTLRSSFSTLLPALEIRRLAAVFRGGAAVA
jgi:hypothetical protein